MGGVPPQGLAHNPLSWSNRKAHSSVNNIQEKMALEDGICEGALCAPERDGLVSMEAEASPGLLILVRLPLL